MRLVGLERCGMVVGIVYDSVVYGEGVDWCW